MAIIWKKIYIFLFYQNFLLHGSGMEPEQPPPNVSVKRHDQLRKWSSDLSADADPFYPQQFTTAAAGKHPLRSDHDSLMIPYPRDSHFLIEKTVGAERERGKKLPVDPFGQKMDSPLEARNEHGKECERISADENAQTADYYANMPPLRWKNLCNNGFGGVQFIRNAIEETPMQQESFDQREKEIVSMLEESETRDGIRSAFSHEKGESEDRRSSSVQSQRSIVQDNEGLLVKSETFEEIKPAKEMVNLNKAIEISDIPGMELTHQQLQQSEHHHHMDAATSKTVIKDMLKDAMVKDGISSDQSLKKVSKINEGAEKSRDFEEIKSDEQENVNLKQDTELFSEIPIELQPHNKQPAEEQQHHLHITAASSKTSAEKWTEAEKPHIQRKGNAKMNKAKTTGKLKVAPTSFSNNMAGHGNAEEKSLKKTPGKSVVKHSSISSRAKSGSRELKDPSHCLQQTSTSGANLNKDDEHAIRERSKNPFEVLLTVEQDVNKEGGDLAIQPMPAPTNPKTSGSKGKAVVIDKMSETEFSEILYTKVDTIVDSIQKLKKNKAKCLENIDEVDEQKKKEEINNLMEEYIKIMITLEEFYESYYLQIGNSNGIAYIYIGDLFTWMNRDHLTPIMQESLAYLDVNLKNSEEDIMQFDQFFINVDILKKDLLVYDKVAKTRGPDHPVTERAKTEMMQRYTKIIESEFRRVLHFLCLGLFSAENVNANLSGHAITFGLSMLSMALPKRKEFFLEAIIPALKYLKIVKEHQEKTGTDRTAQFKQLPALRQAFSSRVSDDKSKSAVVVNDKMAIGEGVNVVFNMIVKSIKDLVYKLANDKVECINFTGDEQLKEDKLSKLKKDYIRIMDDLEEFSTQYYRGANELLYIGLMFDGINKAYEAPMLDSTHLTRIMEETLAYLDENLGDLDTLFEKTDCLKQHLVAYEAGTKDAKAKMIEFYTKNMRFLIYNVIGSLHLGLYMNETEENVNLSRDTVYSCLATLSVAMPGREYEFRQSRLTVDKYLEIVHGPEEENRANTKVYRATEKIRNEDKKIQDLSEHVEFVLKKIETLKEEITKCKENNDPGKRMRLKFNYKSVVMTSLYNFATDFGKKYGDSSHIVLFKDMFEWMEKWYKNKGKEKFKADELITIMQSCLLILQGNKNTEDLTNFVELLHEIANLKSRANKCEKSANKASADGYKILGTRQALQELHEFYIQIVVPKFREAFGYLFIGQKIQSTEPLTKMDIVTGLDILSKTAESRYKQDFHESVNKMSAFYKFMHQASVQEIGDNLTEYVVKVLQLDFAPGEGTVNLEMIADKLKYPQIYVDGLAAIDELKKQIIKKEKKSLIINSPTGRIIGDKKGKKKAAGKRIETVSTTDFESVNLSNIKNVLAETRKLIRYANIMMKIIDVEKRAEKKVYEEAIYLRTWTILFRDELSSMLNEWKENYFDKAIADEDSVNRKGGNEGTIIGLYSEAIYNFFAQQNKKNKANGEKIRIALKKLSQLHKLWHGLTHLRKWLNPDEKLDANSADCNCKEFDYLKLLF